MKTLTTIRAICAWLIVLCILLGPVAWVTRMHAQNDICIPGVGGLGGIPTPDGVVENYTGPLPAGMTGNDNGWNGATRFNLTQNGINTHAAFQTGISSGFAYFAFMVTSPPANLASINSTIVIGISPQDGDPAHDWRIHIRPFDNAPLGIGQFFNETAFEINYWRNSGTWNTGAGPTTANPGFWLKDNTKYSKDGSSWALEMRIPMVAAGAAGGDTGIFFPSPTNFKLYVNILSTNDLTGTFTQSPWPTSAPVPMGGFLNSSTPAVANWGTASLVDRSECKGVSLDWSNIGVELPAMSDTLVQEIKRYPGPFVEANATQCAALAEDFDFTGPGARKGPVNTFYARPSNAAGGPTAQVSVNFKVANWGVPGTSEWQPMGKVAGGLNPPVGVIGNPTTQQSISPGATRTYRPTWQLSYRWSCIYRFPEFEHQCIRAEMTSSDPSTILKNRSVEKNMDFVPASTFRRKARISGDRGPLPPGRSSHGMVIFVEMDQQGAVGGSGTGGHVPVSRTAGVKPAFRQLRSNEVAAEASKHFRSSTNLGLWIARTFVKTGRTLNINGKQYEYTEPAGDFGYVAGHDGPVELWRFGFSGSGLQKLSEDTYLIEVLPTGAAEVETVIEAVEPNVGGGNFKRWGLSLHAGVSIPHGNFSNGFDPGPNVGVDLEYRFTPNFSIEGIYNFHRFNGERFGSFTIPDLNIHQLSLNGKVYGSTSPWRPFFNFGGGAYHVTSSTHGGVNVGGGLQFDVTPSFAVEGMYNFHNIFTSGSNTKFSAVQGGVRFRF